MQRTKELLDIVQAGKQETLINTKEEAIALRQKVVVVVKEDEAAQSAELMLNSIYDSLISTEEASSAEEETATNTEETKDVGDVVKMRAAHSQIEAGVELLLGEVYKEAIERNCESVLLRRLYS